MQNKITYCNSSLWYSTNFLTLNPCLQVDVLCKELQVLGLCEREGVPSLRVTAAVKEVRPYLVCCVIHHLDLTNDLFKRFISLQVRFNKPLNLHSSF